MRLKVADLLRGRNTQEALKDIVALMGQHFRVERVGYGQLDPVQDVFEYDICWTDSSVPPLLGRYPAAAFGVKIVAALNAGRTVAVEDLLIDQLSSEQRTHETARSVDTRAILVVPFIRDGRLRTIVYLNSRAPRRWSQDDVAFMEEIAERTRLVIERDLAEAQLREMNATLEKRVAERTRELQLAQDALLQSQKMEAVGQLVSGLAHDFNNVLAAVKGALEIVRRRPDNAERVREIAAAGLEASARGAKLTAQLLAFARSQRIQLQPIFVRDVVEAIRDLLVGTVGPMIKLEMHMHPVRMAVMADPTQVEMMLLNLAINARDAMPDGGTLAIGVSPRSISDDAEIGNGDYVEVWVRDTGTGMDQETLRRAMEPFFTTKPVGKGTGLGLAQIYGSARQAGGTVRIESAPGAGTTVRVLLPRTTEAPTVHADGDPGPDFSARPAKLLLVDDDDIVRPVLAESLRVQGHTVTEAADGPAALAMLEAERPDLVISDFAMPGMNGAELARYGKQRWPDLPFIFISGFADVDAITSAISGEVVILMKPFDSQDLLAAINRVHRPLS